MTTSLNAVSWFEIGTQDLARSEAFYATVLGRPMLRREQMGPSVGSVFPYTGEGAAKGVGGALLCGPSAPVCGAGGTLVYLDASPSLDGALSRVERAGGQVALSKQALPPGMGFFAHVNDPDGNRDGLFAMA